MATTQADNPTTQAATQPPPSQRIEELSDSDDFEDEEDEGEVQLRATAAVGPSYPPVPVIFSASPLIRDELETETSAVQDGTVEACLPFLTGNPHGHKLNSYGIPNLQRSLHVSFLKSMLGKYPGKFMAMDASRPWIFYWALAGEAMLGVDVSVYRERLTYTAASCRHPDGGFGGGHGQTAHVAPSYAITLAIAMVGGEEAADIIDRKAMWQWLGRMKQRDGGFTLCEGGEEDIRGAYCAMVIICLLNLPLGLPPDSPARVNGDETFLTGLADWVGRCQSFEGGIAASPGNEAHGGYAFCALGALCILGQPQDIIPKTLHLPSLMAWLSSRQVAPEGGFSGRTNKLVDGCYSQWVGGCWPLIEAALAEAKDGGNGGLVHRLYSREGLARYILSCNQAKRGGLRDKPGKPPDSYHTCYNLAGLNVAQHRFKYVPPKMEEVPLSAAFHWELADDEVGPEEGRVWDDEDVVDPIDPVFLIPVGKAKELRKYFEQKIGF